MSKAGNAKRLLTELAERAKAGDGLAMDHVSRMARAKQQGYRDEVFYHGASDDISGFRETKMGKAGEGGVYFTNDPERASKYASMSAKFGSRSGRGDAPNVTPSRLRMKNPYISEAGMPYNEDIKSLANAGYDGIILKGEMPGGGDEVIAFSPDQIRSVNAAFDPAKKDSSNLLASLAPAAVGLGALAGGEEAEAGGVSAARAAIKKLGYKMFRGEGGSVDIHTPDGAFIRKYHSPQAALDDLGGNKTVSPDSYQGEHQAPYRDTEGYHPSLEDISSQLGDDIYSPQAKRYYGGTPSSDEAIDIIQGARGNPDREVDIYRAVPSGVGDDINARDWVSLTEDYAKQHGESALNGDYKIIKQKAKASDLFNEGYVDEWGFDPKSLAAIGSVFGAAALTPEKSYASIINAPKPYQSSLAGDALKYGSRVDTIEAAKHPFAGAAADMLLSIEDPTGRPYESTANVLSGWGYGRPASWLDLGLSATELLDPSMLPVLLAGSAEYMRKNRDK